MFLRPFIISAFAVGAAQADTAPTLNVDRAGVPIGTIEKDFRKWRTPAKLDVTESTGIRQRIFCSDDELEVPFMGEGNRGAVEQLRKIAISFSNKVCAAGYQNFGGSWLADLRLGPANGETVFFLSKDVPARIVGSITFITMDQLIILADFFEARYGKPTKAEDVRSNSSANMSSVLSGAFWSDDASRIGIYADRRASNAFVIMGDKIAMEKIIGQSGQSHGQLPY